MYNIIPCTQRQPRVLVDLSGHPSGPKSCRQQPVLCDLPLLTTPEGILKPSENKGVIISRTKVKKPAHALTLLLGLGWVRS